MQILLRDYPREAWPDHPDFAEAIQHWMSAHQMFRRLGQILHQSIEQALENNMDPEQFAGRLGQYGNLLVRNLHGHHGWEDHQFFPELVSADDRFARGLEMLENDHVELDALLHRLTTKANRYLQMLQLSPKDASAELAALSTETGAIGGFLDRHLSDEEDLVVPILLHHKLRG
ncbi:Hemerythrin HHE cation binding domain-containing protein [Shimia gijangensis]|uniref:Hemerythrin HHE cation binding domain-containing protein n=1 Tax=Shimia gijangensis TaxID=1470563 RepID=A0A1M6D5T2_9RHOB|nr:hemerythrin domain-containing protein [Shimia gijangensis]SHI68474.1 Hemerythrin HHE cation binding domain-containing protein [Shimia gijangensis]